MKKIVAIMVIFAMAISFAACGKTNAEPETKQNTTQSAAENSTKAEPTNGGKKVLIAYFSATGKTKRIAEYAADSIGADIFEILPAKPYTEDDLDYSNSNSRANSEMNDENSRPEISTSVENMADYDVVFIGYPIWWGEAPRIIATFVESYDFTGKTVVTFCTSGGSTNNDSAIKALASGANWITGERFSGNSSKSDVADWIGGLDTEVK